MSVLLFILDGSGVWKTSNSHPVDFSDFPTFNPNRGRAGSTILLVLSKKGPVLYPVPYFFSSIQQFRFLPVCSASTLVEAEGKSKKFVPFHCRDVFFSVDFLVNQIPHNFQDKIIDDVKNALPLMGVLICARMNRTMK